MRITITRKIVFSYLIVIMVSFVLTGTFFSLGAKSYVERQFQRSLEKSANAVSRILNSDLSALRKYSNGENESTEIVRMMMGVRDVMRNSSGSRYAILAKDYKLIYPRNNDETEKLKNIILPAIKDKANPLGESKIKFEAEKVEYMAVVLPVYSKNENNSNVLAWIVIYTGIEQVNQLGANLLIVLLGVLLLSGFMAVIIGIIIARSIAKPIIVLKNRAERLSRRDFDSKVHIDTGDELADLASSIDKMAFELKEYDIVQKKFLQNASHELKTPLMSIQGYAEGIKDGVFEDNAKALDIIVDETKRLKNIVEELIFLSKLETLEDFYKFQPGSVNEVIEKSVEKIESLAIKNNKNIKTVLGADCELNMDRDKFVQALINILGNCLRYAKNEIVIRTYKEGKNLIIKVNDDGQGFDEDDIKNVFERFYKGKKGSTGLGMAITKTIIEKHSGLIRIANRPQGGAEFDIRLEIG